MPVPLATTDTVPPIAWLLSSPNGALRLWVPVTPPVALTLITPTAWVTLGSPASSVPTK